jgi:hypothetical protein
MQLTTLLLSLSLASTAFTAPLLARRELYNIDGEPVPGFDLETDKKGHIIPPADWPYYDSLDMHCEAHKNYVPRIGIKMWKRECVPSMYCAEACFQYFDFARRMLTNHSEVYQWKVDHNVFESREVAAEAKANEEKRRKSEEKQKKNSVTDCKKTPEALWCRMMRASKDAKKQQEEEKEEQEKGGDGDGDGVEVGA